VTDHPLLDLCAECARRGGACCHRTEIYVTLGDVARIREHTGTDDFYEWREEDEPGYYSPDDDPIWCYGTICPDGRRRLLKRRENGDCHWLTPTGCKLPREVRPLVCRLHPWDYGDQGLRGVIQQHCPTDLLPEGVTAVEVMGIDEELALVWHAMLYTEIMREFPLTLPDDGE
jgi:uncharacterized protein